VRDAADLHNAMFDAIRDRDYDAMRELFAADSVHTSGDGEPSIGPEPVLAEVQAFVEAFPDLTIDVRHQHVPESSRSIIEYTFRGTHEGRLDDIPPTGKPIAVPACSVLEAQHGAIRRESDYYDTMAILAQLDVTPD
jgi:steroid delta-isomerase-like uncharacterized protein